MSIFKKRETIVENITYMAIMAAINVIFVLLTYFVPFLLFLLVFVLPLSSAIVAIYCKKKYYPIYAIVTIGICMLVTISDFGDTIFFVVPSVITGFLFGTLIKAKIPSIVVITITALTQVILTYPGLWIATTVLYPSQEDIFVVVAKGIGIKSDQIVSYAKHMIICAIALAQEVISFIVIKEESNKLGISIEDNNPLNRLVPMCCIFGFSILSLVFSLFYAELSYPFMLGSTLFVVYEIILLFQEKKKWIYIAIPVAALVGIMIFAALYNSTPKPLGFLNFQYFYCLVGIIVFINNYLLTLIKKR